MKISIIIFLFMFPLFSVGQNNIFGSYESSNKILFWRIYNTVNHDELYLNKDSTYILYYSAGSLFGSNESKGKYRIINSRLILTELNTLKRMRFKIKNDHLFKSTFIRIIYMKDYIKNNNN